MKKPLTGKEWFARLEHAFPGTLERVCRDMGLRLGRDLDKEAAGALQEFSDLTGGPQLTPAMVGHARREFGIVRRAALPRPVPAPSLAPTLAEPEVIELKMLPIQHDEGDGLDDKISAALERILPQLLHRMYTGYDHRHPAATTTGREGAPHA